MKNILISPNVKIIYAMKRLSKTAEGCLIVTDNNKKILGTLNVLHKEKYYTKKSVNKIKPFVQLLAPYFIIHQLSMKKK